MNLLISQKTVCRYSKPIPRARLEFRVLPAGSDEQHVLRLSVKIDPSDRTAECVDSWGNRYRLTEWDRPVDSWSIALDAHVRTLRDNPFDFSPAAALLPLPPDDREFPPETRPFLKWALDPWDNDPDVAAWAEKTSLPVSGAFEKIQKIMNWIYHEFQFRKGETGVATPPGEFLRIRMGVCQDFATLLIAAARSLGLPARYVSGYLYEGPRAKRPAPASTTHGWAEIYFRDIGWRGFDALNGLLACQTHVRLAHGRWFSNCSPVIGRLTGPAVEQTTVTEIHVDLADADGRNMEAA